METKEKTTANVEFQDKKTNIKGN